MPTLRMRIAGVVEFEVSEEQFEWFEKKERVLAERSGTMRLALGLAPGGFPRVEHDFAHKEVRIERALV